MKTLLITERMRSSLKELWKYFEESQMKIQTLLDLITLEEDLKI